MENTAKNRQAIYDLLKEVSREGVSQEQLLQYYGKRAGQHDDEMVIIKAEFYNQIVRAALEYCPGSQQNVKILDVGTGTGLVGKELKALGFNHIDGVDPSSESLQVAETKKVYNKLMCQYFTREPMDIPANYYDIIVTCGTFLEGHLPYDCLHEMIRLVRQGGIICIVTRASIFDGISTPAYKVLPLIKELERNGSLRKLKWEAPVPYSYGVEGISLVFEVL